MVELQHKCRINVGSSDLKILKIIMRPSLIISPQDILMKHLVFLLYQLFKDRKKLLPHRFPWGCIERLMFYQGTVWKIVTSTVRIPFLQILSQFKVTVAC